LSATPPPRRRLLAASNAQGLANLAWAYANAGAFDEALFEALAEVCARRIGEFSAQALANVGARPRLGLGNQASHTVLIVTHSGLCA
jgi:hypothetical protein